MSRLLKIAIKPLSNNGKIVAEENRPELLMPFYGFVLIVFFAYCYPIARLTIALERRFAVKL